MNHNILTENCFFKGTYSCHCKYGYTGDGKKSGSGCKEIKCDNKAGFQIGSSVSIQPQKAL